VDLQRRGEEPRCAGVQEGVKNDEPRREARYFYRRLGFRVPFIVFCWLLPHAFTIAGYPMPSSMVEPYQSACVGGLVIAFGFWFSGQGHRRPTNNRGSDEKEKA
jgi:hypothetical protein